MSKTVKKKVALISLGCAKNLVDSEVLLGGLKHENYTIVDEPENSNIIIVNTCGFLDSAREESVDVIIEAGELKAGGDVEKVVVMGCFSDRYGTELRKELPEVDEFFGTSDHAEILSFLTGKEYAKKDPDYYRSLLTPNHYAYLKIAEGCDNGCSFCSIPIMRGLQKSQPLAWNIQQAKMLADRGVKELLVIAQDSTSYGWDLQPKSTLHELMTHLDKVEGLDWIRLHYAHPAHLHRDMIAQFGQLEKLIPYIDMPIQHASDRLLKSMRRGLNSQGIRKRIDALRQANPDIAIRTSIIVGYPGETDKDFDQLYSFVEDVEFDRLGVFTYSEEEGTHAAFAMKDDIPTQIKYDRMDAIMMLQQDINLMKNEQLVGHVEKIMIDKNNDDGSSQGRTFRDSPEIDNIVKIDGIHPVGEFLKVKFTSATEYEITGKKYHEK
ncbi:MAG: 30S ribosomal protein S12 methylthiotransferase RimO [Candidatus Marinimicrobia bacterium]|jgi:ribosomal protein S12 methylthiotransferase|nr:30S ribosomal protein S12 methylthiotransferase RimO [Candidatus Neomarinimicrobiota bacterium]MBT3634365.1 30S ribosomal protein S12 methylthiotransferase RimO [Candidatus Neomarinimicrobiota bacterium]MBT3681726.1 30S ribosomal protein S12 methylthiotransferase RimO [Candidatus Neomarinimicrobiota bacterium]MBT3759452.1 30S ribosomal protein S12 methylthiotransferase RimO [Candidatus Neomarinimicrobiota bacterium]MBT3895940.1 30S ribosomal protein S12 methylthiotransferase RimO [Candidatus